MVSRVAGRIELNEIYLIVNTMFEFDKHSKLYHNYNFTVSKALSIDITS